MRSLTILLLFVASSLAAQPIKVMTYNIRLDTKSDGVNQWDNRKEKVFSLLKKYDPDIFGVQEALHNQMRDIADNVGDFSYIGVGRDDGKEKGEYSAIFFRKDRFTVLGQNTFWLSRTPDVPGSKDWDAAITRVATWGKLQDKKTGRQFLIINTHFDHVGKESRKNAAAIIKEKARAIAGGLPVIITGDFNITRDTPPYAVMMDPSEPQLVDAAPDSPPTFCGFKVNAMPCVAIDYIFHTRDWRSDKFQVVNDNDGQHYPSDHLPVIVSLSLKK